MKNCPFCGSAAVGPAYYTQTDGQERTMIQCSKCGATGPSRAYSSEWDDEEAEASWDKRHNVEVSGLRGFSHRSARLPGWASLYPSPRSNVPSVAAR